MWTSAFKVLFTNRLLTLFADALLFFALLKEVEQRVSDPTLFVWFYVAYYVPVLFLSLPIGAWMESKQLKRVIRFSNVARAVCLLLIVFLLPILPLLYVLIFLAVLSVLDLFFLPASQSFLPRIVPEQHRPRANSWFQMAITTVRIIAQVFAGISIMLNVPVTYLLVVAMICLAVAGGIATKLPAVRNVESCREALRLQIVAGFRYMLSHTKLRWLFAFVSVGMFVAMSFELVIIHFLTEPFGLGLRTSLG